MIARRIHKASETKSSFTWTEESQEAFESLKKHLSSTPILVFPDVKEQFILYTDASLTAMGAVLAQVQDEKASYLQRIQGIFTVSNKLFCNKTETFSDCNFHSSF